jgi:hypothetical protein
MPKTKHIFVVGEQVGNDREIVAIDGDKFTVKHLACGHVRTLTRESLREKRSGCARCKAAERGLKQTGRRNGRFGKSTVVGRVIGTFRVIQMATQRKSQEVLYEVECVVCGYLEAVAYSSIDRRRCKQCKESLRKATFEKAAASPRQFTPVEVESLRVWIRKGVQSVLHGDDKSSHYLSNTSPDDCCGEAWEQLLLRDLEGLPFESVERIACCIAKNMARRNYGYTKRFVEPYTNEEGMLVHPLDSVETPEPDYAAYQFGNEEIEGSMTTLEKHLRALPESDRNLLLRDRAELNAVEQAEYDGLFAEAKASLLRTLTVNDLMAAQ